MNPSTPEQTNLPPVTNPEAPTVAPAGTTVADPVATTPIRQPRSVIWYVSLTALIYSSIALLTSPILIMSLPTAAIPLLAGLALGIIGVVKKGKSVSPYPEAEYKRYRSSYNALAAFGVIFLLAILAVASCFLIAPFVSAEGFGLALGWGIPFSPAIWLGGSVGLLGTIVSGFVLMSSTRPTQASRSLPATLIISTIALIVLGSLALSI